MLHFLPGPDVLPVPAPDAVFTGLRALGPEDRDALADHFVRLDEKTRRLRFGNAVNDAFLRLYANEPAAGSVRRIGLFEAGPLRGVAELHPLTATPEAAEAAFSLEAPFRRAGNGTRLFAAVLAEARLQGVRQLTLHCLRENLAMRRLARRFSSELCFEGSDVTATLRVPTPGFSSALTL